MFRETKICDLENRTISFPSVEYYRISDCSRFKWLDEHKLNIWSYEISQIPDIFIYPI